MTGWENKYCLTFVHRGEDSGDIFTGDKIKWWLRQWYLGIDKNPNEIKRKCNLSRYQKIFGWMRVLTVTNSIVHMNTVVHCTIYTIYTWFSLRRIERENLVSISDSNQQRIDAPVLCFLISISLVRSILLNRKSVVFKLPLFYIFQNRNKWNHTFSAQCSKFKFTFRVWEKWKTKPIIMKMNLFYLL